MGSPNDYRLSAVADDLNPLPIPRTLHSFGRERDQGVFSTQLPTWQPWRCGHERRRIQHLLKLGEIPLNPALVKIAILGSETTRNAPSTGWERLMPVIQSLVCMRIAYQQDARLSSHLRQRAAELLDGREAVASDR